jgi:phage/plasmid-associated DNA primase
LQLAREIEAKSNPYEAFVQDRCVLDPAASVGCTLLYIQFQVWCGENGRDDLLKRAPTSQLFAKQLKKHVSGLERLETFRKFQDKREYFGIRLKTKAEREGP